VIYVNKVTYAEHIALVKGDISTSDPVLVRMHALNVLDDVLGDRGSGKGGQLQAAMQQIAAVGRGVVVLIREPSATTLSDTVRARLEHEGAGGELRDYGVGAQILLDLGIRDMILLSNSQKNIVGLDGYGLSIVERRPISNATEKGA
jgi:3,4-dihydroxy 2-butanone 4-phosphate synthase / GTP cyclohydrolase II